MLSFKNLPAELTDDPAEPFVRDRPDSLALAAARVQARAEVVTAILDRPKHLKVEQTVRTMTTTFELAPAALPTLAMELDAAGDLEAARAAWEQGGFSEESAMELAMEAVEAGYDRERVKLVTEVNRAQLDEELLARSQARADLSDWDPLRDPKYTAAFERLDEYELRMAERDPSVYQPSLADRGEKVTPGFEPPAPSWEFTR